MGKNRMKGKHLRKIDFPSDIAKSTAINIMMKHYKHASMEEKLNNIQNVLLNPDNYLEHEFLMPLARAISGKPKLKTDYEVHMLKKSGHFSLFGERYIAHNAYTQMESAIRLPVAAKGALMPDAHHGYGLPIGGVLGTVNSVIPFGVGLDIGCRMALSIYEMPGNYIEKKQYDLKKALQRYTHFGNEGTLDFEVDHPVLERPEFQQTELLKRLHGKAWYQLGSSGTGNHFVEFGVVQIDSENTLGLNAGTYTGLLSHSGSRGMGAAIAAMFTKTATQKCRLPKEAQALAWLSLDEEAGQEYWMSMNLAGDYAKACHDVIHRNMERVLGLKAVRKVENHHNFAWKEIHDGQELIVHRKGATPAAKGELGIIPGSMTSRGFIVSGLGHEASLNSASHGAGRKLSRKEARESVTKSQMNKQLNEAGITLIGGSVEESTYAYKDIEAVIASQQELVHIEGTFTPKIVRMNKS
ncbi:MAG: RtcB family protein [Bacteroidetes bacterium]|nr:RtcB family protein [Bacteroidota bacterium]